MSRGFGRVINTDPSAGALYLDQPLAKSSNAEARAAGEYDVDHDKDATNGRKDTYLHGLSGAQIAAFGPKVEITGYACACTPYTDHAGTGYTGTDQRDGIAAGQYARTDGASTSLSLRPREGPRREYHHDQWTPAPTTPGVICDPFGGRAQPRSSPPPKAAPRTTSTCPSTTAASPGGGSPTPEREPAPCKWRNHRVEMTGQDDLLALIEPA